VDKAAPTPRSYEFKTPTSTLRKNRLHFTPLPEQQQQQPQQRLTSPENKAVTPIWVGISDSMTN